VDWAVRELFGWNTQATNDAIATESDLRLISGRIILAAIRLTTITDVDE
jgi:hypothetical protein